MQINLSPRRVFDFIMKYIAVCCKGARNFTYFLRFYKVCVYIIFQTSRQDKQNELNVLARGNTLFK